MSHSYEFVFGYRYKDFHKLSTLIPDIFLKDLQNDGLDDDLDQDELNELYQDAFSNIQDSFEPFNQKLAELSPQLLAGSGFQVLPSNLDDMDIRDDSAFSVSTPKGKREFAPIQLESYFEPNEFGELIEDSLIGIRLSGRYYPVFLDWENAEGGFYNFALNDQFTKMAEIAKQRIVEMAPEFADAELIIRECHY